MQANQQPQNASVSLMELFSDAHGVCLDNGDIMMPPTSKFMAPLWLGNPWYFNSQHRIESQSLITFYEYMS